MSKTRLLLKAEVLIKGKDKPKGLVYNTLVNKLDIDEDYYNVEIVKLNIVEDSHTLDMRADVEYRLRRYEWWNELEECKERLRIGL